MGGSQSISLKEAIVSHNTERLSALLSAAEVDQASRQEALNRPLNRKGDTALILAIRHEHYDLVEPILTAGCSVHARNKLKETAFDLLVSQILAGNESANDEQEVPSKLHKANSFDRTVEEAVKSLLKAGANSPSLQKLALHHAEHPEKLQNLCQTLPSGTLLPDLRLSCLLLQVSAWCNHQVVLENLLKQGVETANFWHTPFMPVIVPNTRFRGVPWPKTEEGDYFIPSLPEPETVQALKWGMLQDWRAEWEGSQTASDQYRAGLQLPPSTALTFIKAANHPMVLCRIMEEIMAYLPPLCGGLDLRTSPLVPYLILAGYIFSAAEIEHLALKYGRWNGLANLCKKAHALQSLKHMCRKCIRGSMKSNVLYSVQQLQCVPTKIKQYICLEDEGTREEVRQEVEFAVPVET